MPPATGELCPLTAVVLVDTPINVLGDACIERIYWIFDDINKKVFHVLKCTQKDVDWG